MKSRLLLLFFFSSVFLSGLTYASEPVPEFLFNVTHTSPLTDLVIPNLVNTFSTDVACFKQSNHYQNGDVVDFVVIICADQTCVNVDTFQAVYRDNCHVQKSYDYFVPTGTNNVFVKINVKRFDDPQVSYANYFNTKFDTYSPPPITTNVVQKKTLNEQVFFGFITLPIICFIMLVLGIVLLAFRKIFGLVLILLAIVLFIFGMFF